MLTNPHFKPPTNRIRCPFCGLWNTWHTPFLKLWYCLNEECYAFRESENRIQNGGYPIWISVGDLDAESRYLNNHGVEMPKDWRRR